MTQWPNWVDLIVVTVFLKSCYSGFGRGLWSELLTLAGVVAATAITINYYEAVAGWLRLGMWFGPQAGTFLTFWLLFLTLMFVVYLVRGLIGEILRWERLHWSVQGLGMILGGVRGLWWTGLTLLVMTSSGFDYLKRSVTEESLFGPRLVGLSARAIAQVANWCPGAGQRKQLTPRAK